MDYKDDGIFTQGSLDIMALVGLIISMANYGENLDQSKAQEIINNAVSDIHVHLASQDAKINIILQKIGGDISCER